MVSTSTSTTIYEVFPGKPKGQQGWPTLEFDCEHRRNYLSERLSKECGNMRFIGGDLIYESKEIEIVKEKIKREKGIDGILVYFTALPAPSAEKLLDTGYPTIIANDLFGGDLLLLKSYDFARRQNLPVLPISSSDIDDMKKALRFIEVIHELKKSKILIIEESKDIGDQSHSWRRRYEDYLMAMKTFGVEPIVIGPEKLNKYYEESEEKEAEKIATKWENEAIQVIEPTKAEIVKSARLYLAMKKLMRELNANVITIDCLSLFYKGKLPAYPCLGFFQLNNEGLIGVCEADSDAALSHLIGQLLTGRPGYVSDPVINTASSQIIYAHCVATNRPFGKSKPASPYKIRSHAEDHKGASIQTLLPAGQPLTTIKLNLLDRKLAIHSAKSVGNIDDERACRTKLVAEAPVSKILDNWDYQTFGWHRVTFFGDFRKDFCNLAKLLGLMVIEEDR